MNLNVAQTLERSEVNGPGKRFVVWVQGCSFHCAGCWNPDTWEHRPRRLVDTRELVEQVLRVESIEGITLTGGEPFEQPEPLAMVVGQLREAGLSVVAFTGYELEALTSPGMQLLLELCDVLITGRYERDQRTLDLPLRGSRNQKAHLLTDRYREADLNCDAACEVHLDMQGKATMTGFPPHEDFWS